METPAFQTVLRNKLPVLAGNPQLNNVGKQQSVENSTVSISTSLNQQHEQNRVSRPTFRERISLWSKHGFVTAGDPANDTNDVAFLDAQSTTTSMVVTQGSYAASEVDNEPLIDEPAAASALGRPYTESEKSHNDELLGSSGSEESGQLVTVNATASSSGSQDAGQIVSVNAASSGSRAIDEQRPSYDTAPDNLLELEQGGNGLRYPEAAPFDNLPSNLVFQPVDGIDPALLLWENDENPDKFSEWSMG